MGLDLMDVVFRIEHAFKIKAASFVTLEPLDAVLGGTFAVPRRLLS